MSTAASLLPSQSQTLASMVRAKNPGAYDDMDDATLESKILAKYPQYSDLPRSGGQKISDTSTIGPAPKPSLYQEAAAPVRQVAAPIINNTLGALPWVGKYMQMNPTPTPGTAISNIENTTPAGRAAHPWAAGFGGLLNNAGELSRTVAPEVSTLGTADMMPWMRSAPTAEATSTIGKAMQSAKGAVGDFFRDPVTGKLKPVTHAAARAVGAGVGYEAGKTADHPMEGLLVGGALGPEAADAMIPASQSATYEQRAAALMKRGREQDALDRQATRQAKVNQPAPFSGTSVPEQQAAIPQQNYTTPAQDFATRQAATPNVEVGRTGSAQQPFEPLVYSSPQEAAQNDIRMANLKRQASSAGTYHAAQGAAGKVTNLQQRIGRKYPWSPQ